jgi:hypothetical protein
LQQALQSDDPLLDARSFRAQLCQHLQNIHSQKIARCEGPRLPVPRAPRRPTFSVRDTESLLVEWSEVARRIYRPGRARGLENAGVQVNQPSRFRFSIRASRRMSSR